MATKRLVVSGDDLGLLPEINRGLARTAAEGLLTSFSLLANGPAFEEGAVICRRHPKMGLGAHLALVEGRALTSRDEGGLGFGEDRLLPGDYRAFVRAWCLGRISKKRVEIELRCQLERILSEGLEPDHLDGHQHLHLFPPLAPVFARLGREYGIRGVRVPQDPNPDSMPCGESGRKKVRLLGWCAHFAIGAYGRGFVKPQVILGLSESGDLTLDRFRRALKLFSAGPGLTAELMCHPGDGQADALRRQLHQAGYVSPWDFHWRTEQAMLCSAEARRFLEALDMELVTYRELDEADPHDEPGHDSPGDGPGNELPDDGPGQETSGSVH